MNDDSTVFTTEHFIVSHVHCERDKDPDRSGYCGDVYVAFYHTNDIPRPVCIVTLCGNYVEWVETMEEFRRNGVATEVLRGLESHVGCLEMCGVTEAGEKFVEKFCAEDVA